MTEPHNLLVNPLHLGLGASAVVQPAFTGMDWYQGYGQRHDDDGAEGRLVSMHRFTESWDSWEMHPAGDEVVLCTAGRMTLHQEYADGTTATVIIGPGPVCSEPPGMLAHSRCRGGGNRTIHHRRSRHTTPPAVITKRDARHARFV